MGYSGSPDGTAIPIGGFGLHKNFLLDIMKGLAKSGNNQEAVVVLTELSSHDADVAEIFNLWTLFCDSSSTNNGDRVAEQTECRRAIEKDPSNLAPAIALMNLLSGSGQYQQAIELYRGICGPSIATRNSLKHFAKAVEKKEKKMNRKILFSSSRDCTTREYSSYQGVVERNKWATD